MVKYVSNFYLIKAKLHFIYCTRRKEFNTYCGPCKNETIHYLSVLKTITIIIKIITMKIKIRVNNLTAKYIAEIHSTGRFHS
jgi:hypothetical protein